jgi:glycine hydroxymethyltransferase
MNNPLAKIAVDGVNILSRSDPALYDLLTREYHRQTHTLSLVAASGIADPSVLACQGSIATNITTEGYPGRRFHGGCELVDEIEQLAIERAKAVYQARYANVQPHSGTSANEIVLFSVLNPGDTVLGMELNCGGHLTHGSSVSISGNCFRAVGYGLNERGLIDYDQIARLSKQFKPNLIIAGASSYPRKIDFETFRQIADEAGAYLLADISHIAGLVAAGEHPNPIDAAHFTTTSTYKQLGGPRGGLILMGKDFDQSSKKGEYTLAESIQRTVFPYFQGTPNLSAIAGKACALAMVSTSEFKDWARNVRRNAAALAQNLQDRQYRVLTGGSDNHMVLIDVYARGITGSVAEKSLGECGVVVNKNRIPNDQKGAMTTSGLRLGTNIVTARGMQVEQMAMCADLVDEVLSSIAVLSDQTYRLDPAVKELALARVADLCRRFPILNYNVFEVS